MPGPEEEVVVEEVHQADQVAEGAVVHQATQMAGKGRSQRMAGDGELQMKLR